MLHPTIRTAVKCARGRCRNVAANLTTGLCHSHYRVIPHGYVDSATAIQRFALLRSRGLSQRRIAVLSGLDRETLRKLGSWGQGRVELATQNKLMSVPVPPRVVDAGAANVCAVGTKRRIQALMVAGHTQTDIGAYFGVTSQSVSGWLQRNYVSAATAAGVADLFDRLQLIPGSSTRTAERAKRAGHQPAFSWDEDSIDDPDALPDSGPGASVTWLDRYLELRELGVPESRIPERMGITQGGFEQQLRRYGIRGAA
jgi:transcriptional regulator with XRE-family HTH domain